MTALNDKPIQKPDMSKEFDEITDVLFNAEGNKGKLVAQNLLDSIERKSINDAGLIESLRSEVGSLLDQKSMLIGAIQMAYQKHQLGLCDIGWEQLGDKLQNTLCEIMGDEAFNAWVCSMEGMDRSPI